MRTGHARLAAALLAATASGAVAQTVATYDPRQLPAITGQVAQYSLTPRGDVDGIILRDGTQVHLPPHLGPALVQAVKKGDAVTIRGLKAQALPLVQALSITADASQRTVIDTGPPPAPPQPLAMSFEWIEVQGPVRQPLYGPRGDMNGALLEDGTQVHLPPGLAASFGQQLQPGRLLVARGYGATGTYGRSLDARQVGESSTQMVDVGPPGPGPAGPPPRLPGPPPLGAAPPPPLPAAASQDRALPPPPGR